MPDTLLANEALFAGLLKPMTFDVIGSMELSLSESLMLVVEGEELLGDLLLFDKSVRGLFSISLSDSSSEISEDDDEIEDEEILSMADSGTGCRVELCFVVGFNNGFDS